MKIETLDPARMSKSALDDLFRGGQPGPIPTGRSRGTAMLAPGSPVDGALRLIIRSFIWKGKVFTPESQDLKNLLTPFAVRGIRARVYVDRSWFDDAPAIIIDYSRTSLVARMVRDEIRRVAPGVYLGQIFLWRKRVGLFMLELPAEASA